VSIPLQAEGRIFGAMDVYSRTPDAFTGKTVALARIIAGHAGLASQVAAVFLRHRDLAEQMREAMSSRAVTEQAKGVLLAQRKITADVAFGLLQEVSQPGLPKITGTRALARHCLSRSAACPQALKPFSCRHTTVRVALDSAAAILVHCRPIMPRDRELRVRAKRAVVTRPRGGSAAFSRVRRRLRHRVCS
jgi:hypothetical protein